jgi:PAS domain S-box-containing protein
MFLSATNDRTRGAVDLNRLRWRAVWFPTLSIAVLVLGEHLVEYTYAFDQASDLLVLHVPQIAIIALGAYGFSLFTFRLIRQSYDEVLRRNADVVKLEKRFRALIENSTDMVLLLRADGAVRYASPSVTRILGHSWQEKMGHSVLEWVHPHDREQVQGEIHEIARTPGGSGTSTFRIYDKNGNPRWISASWTNLLADSHVAAIVCNARDVTAWKRSEDALRSLTNAVPIGLYRIKPSGEFLDVNPALLHMLGYENRERLLATNAAALYVDPADRERWTTRMTRDGMVQNFEFRARRTDGEVIWLKNSARAVKDDMQGVLCYHGAVEDVTAGKRMEKALADKGAQLAAILQSAMDAVLTIDANSHIVLFNAAAERMFRCLAAEALRKPVSRFVSIPLPAGTSGAMQNIRQPGALGLNGNGTNGHTGRRANGQEFPIETVMWRSESGGETFDTLIVRDVSEYRQAQATLRKLSSAVEHAAEGIFITDRNGIIEYVNHAFENMTGFSRNEAIGMMASLLRFSPHDTSFYEGLRSILLRGDVMRAVFTNHTKDGHSYLVEESIAPIVDAEGNVTHFAHSGRDVTERQRAESGLRESREQLRALAAHLESVREEERTRIAREIHDELGQMLTGLKFDLAWFGSRVSNEKESVVLQERLTAMLSLTDTTIAAVRRIAAALRPRLLDELGLVAAVEWLAQEFRSRTGLVCDLELDVPDVDLDPTISTAVFRIVQEALTNVVRHANASTVIISLQMAGDALSVIVQDNGRGITESQITGSRSLGLLGMRERALVLGGRVWLTRGARGGTTVRVRIPLARAENVKPGDRPAVVPAGV